MDGLGLFVLLLAIVISLLGLWASMGRRGVVSYLLQVSLFIGAVFLMVSSTNLLLFYVLWEMVTILSWSISRRSGFHSYPALGPLPMQGLGGIATVCMFAALMFIAVANRTLSMAPVQSASVVPVTVLLLAAVYLKTYGLLAQTWLPGEPRMAGVSNALVAGAGIVAVGLYPYVRFFWTILGSQEGWRGIALPVSLAIAVVAALIALGERDSHRLLSYGALSQFAWFLAAFAVLGPQQAGALFLALLTCALALSVMFVVLGLAESISGERDIRQSGGLMRVSPLVGVLFVLSALATVGLPPFGGFIGRLSVGLPVIAGGNLSVGLILFGVSGLSLLYLLRLFGMLFLGEVRRPVSEVAGVSEYLAISVVLVILLVIGLASPLLSSWIQVSFAMPFG